MTGSPQLPPQLLAYLSAPELRAVWAEARTRLERNGLQATGTLVLNLDEAAADRLSGLLSRPVRPGAGRRVKLADLDAALRRSSGEQGLLSVLAILGGPVADRRATRRQAQERTAQLWSDLDSALAAAGLADADWVPDWIAGLRRSGVLTRAGVDGATRALGQACAALGLLMSGTSDRSAAVELGALASRVTGDAHGFDDTSLASVVLLRAAALAVGRPSPVSATDRREIWQMLGVATDSVSGTVLTWQLYPPGADAWSRMMRDRAALGLVTHLTRHELDRAGPVEFIAPGQIVSVCENPQVLQAAAAAGVAAPLVCLSGNPAGAGTRLLRSMIAAGCQVRYHGDFDWPGVAIAGRVLALGAAPWRMSAADYRSAAGRLDAGHAVGLSGAPVRTDWDPGLAGLMSARGVAVHEEFVLPDLLADLRGDRHTPYP